MLRTVRNLFGFLWRSKPEPELPRDQIPVASPLQIRRVIEAGAQPFEVEEEEGTRVGGYWRDGRFYITHIERRASARR